jgi:hypothetical protein
MRTAELGANVLHKVGLREARPALFDRQDYVNGPNPSGKPPIQPNCRAQAAPRKGSGTDDEWRSKEFVGENRAATVQSSAYARGGAAPRGQAQEAPPGRWFPAVPA